MRTFRDSKFVHYRPPPGVMSCEEIRWWIMEVWKRQGWGSNVLARYLGMHKNATTPRRKALGVEWIYPREQIRFSHRLDRIISGEVVCRPGRRGWPKYGVGVRGEAVLADVPKPLEQPRTWAWDMKRQRLVPVPPRPMHLPVLPTFKTLLEKPRAY